MKIESTGSVGGVVWTSREPNQTEGSQVIRKIYELMMTHDINRIDVWLNQFPEAKHPGQPEVGEK